MAILYFDGVSSAFLGTPAEAYINTIQAALGSDFTQMDRIKQTNFGDGYNQRAPDGINATMLQGSVVFSSKNPIAAAEIAKFFMGYGDAYPRTPDEYFLWTPPIPFDFLGQLRWTHGARHFTYQGGRLVSITVPLTQVFDP